MALEYFPCYHSYLNKLKKLSDQEVGRLFRALLLYSATGETQELTGRESMAYDFIVDDIDRANANYQKKSEQNRRNRLSTTDNDRTRPYTTDNDRTQSNNKSESKSESDYVLTFSDEKVCRTDAVRRIAEAWNTLGLQNISKITSGTQRDTMLKARLKEYTEDEILQGVEKVRASSFLMGKTNQGWTCTFDWFIRPNNLPKVLSGNYDDAAPKEQQPKTNDELEKITFRSGPVFSDERLERLKQKEAGREDIQKTVERLSDDQ